MRSRRDFLGTLGAAALAGPALLRPAAAARAVAAFAGRSEPSEELARDEALWFEVQQAFAVDRSQVNLNNGGVSPAPDVVQQALKRHIDFSNQLPPVNLWRVLEPQKEPVRARLARLFGCDAEEVAITRNASESLQTCQLGFDLRRGGEVLTTDQDYPRMLATFEQRARREGIALTKISLPVPCEDDAEVVRRFEERITGRTRLLLLCHVVNLTGQILPVRAVVRMARARGVPVVVDGAHSFAHFPFTRDELECDYFGTSLHKWLFGPLGTGMLYVRRERIGDLWPLMAAQPEQREDIRKFEEIGTHPAAPLLALGEAIGFHLGIGPERKAARLRHLRDVWAQRLLAASDRVRLHTSLDARFSCGIACVQVEGLDSGALHEHLWQRHRVATTPIRHAQFEGLRISPSVYTTAEELDRFCDAVEAALRDGLPA